MSQLFKKVKLLFTRSASDNSQDSSDGRDHPDRDNMERLFKRKTRANVGSDAKGSRTWAEQKEKFLAMSAEEKRQFYKTRKPVKLDEVETWPEYFAQYKEKLLKLGKKSKYRHLESRPNVKDTVNSQVSVWRGDITALEIDAITNAANNTLLGGGGVDGAIHSAAGKLLVQECETLDGCVTGYSKITGAYRLPAKYVIHTVGPIGKGEGDLKSCYETSLELALQHKIRSIAFPCISTGIYGFPNEAAAHIALSMARTFLEDNPGKMDRIIFCLFLPKDVEIYGCLMQQYFPLSSERDLPGTDDNGDQRSNTESDTGHTNGSSKKKEHARSPKSSEKKQAKSPKSSEKEQAKSPKSSEKENPKSLKPSEKSTKVETESTSLKPGTTPEQPEGRNQSEMEVASQSDGTGSITMDTGKMDNVEKEDKPARVPSPSKQRPASPAQVHQQKSTCKM